MATAERGRISGDLEFSRQQAMSAGEFTGLEAASDDEADLLGVDGLSDELVNRERRHRFRRQSAFRVEHQNANDVRMRCPQPRQETTPADADAILRDGGVDVDVLQSPRRLRGGTGDQDAIAKFARQDIAGGRPIDPGLRGNQNGSGRIHVIQLCILNSILSEIQRRSNPKAPHGAGTAGRRRVQSAPSQMLCFLRDWGSCCGRRPSAGQIRAG